MAQPRIHIWTGHIGGHMRVAQSVAQGLRAVRPGIQVELIDIYGRANIAPSFSAATNAYDRVVSTSLRAWRAIYHATDHPATLRLLRRVGGWLTHRGLLERSVGPHAPDAIVRVISDLGQLARLRRQAGRLPPVITLINDLVTIHRGWVTPESTDYIVPTASAWQACRRIGVPAGQMAQIGFPIRSELFCGEAAARAPAANGCLRVLVMGGSSGSGRVAEDVERLAAARLPLEFTVVCGKNERLQRRLARLASQAGRQRPVHLLSYTESIPDLMRQADVLLTKAGPGTVFEAVACGLPAVLNASLPGQEDGNVDFFVAAGVACAAPTPAATVDLIEGFVAERARLAELRNPALAAQTCGAARRIAEHILQKVA